MKRIVCFLLTIVMLTAMTGAALAAVNSGMISVGDVLYVITTGGTLNVRADASGNAKVTYKLPNHAPVHALDTGRNGFLWVEFKFNGRFANGYVSMDFLTYTVPSKINENGATKVGDPTPAPAPSAGELVANMNFSNFKLVQPGMARVIASKPNRPGGWVNLRWVPSMDSAIIAKMPKDAIMTVIAEGKTWYQVMNQDGYVGFISKQFTYVVEFEPYPTPIPVITPSPIYGSGNP